MIRSIFFISAAALAPSSVLGADPSIAISAGEHGDFSRIVIDGDDPDLAIETSGRVILLRNIDDTGLIDLGDINDRQKAFRIDHAKRTGADTIELQMNCDCAVRTLRAPDGKTVIDITGSSQRASNASAAEDPVRPAEAPPNEKRVTLEDTLTVAQAHDRMMDLLQQAADDGLVMLKAAPTAPASDDRHDANSAVLREPPSKTANVENKKPAYDAAIPAAAQSIVQASAVAPPAVEPAPRQCLEDHVLTIDGADFEDNPLVEIEALQLRLAETTGAEKDAVSRKLANGFLAIGFGEEALAVLKDKNADAAALFEVAQAVAERTLDPSGALLGATSCSGAHALWQAVADTGAAAPSHYERSGRAVETLPTRLKILIATRLAVKMADVEAWEPAQDLFEIAAGDSDKLSPELKYVRTRLDDHGAKDAASRESLLEVATKNSSASDEALLALAESYAEQGGIPHDGFVEDIGALAKIGGSSRAAFFEAYSWAAAGNLDAAMLLLKNEAPKSPDNAEMAAASASAMISRALSGEDSLLKVAALEAYLIHESWIDPDTMRRDVRALAADAAFSVGLPNLSFDLLVKAGAAPDRETGERLATAALAAGDANAAIRFAAPHATDPAFGALVAKANIQQMNYHAALATAATISDEKVRAHLKSRAGWLSRNWRAATEGFRGVDPSEFDDAAAIRYGLAAYMSGDTSLPGAVDAALSTQAAAIKAGLNSLFQKTAEGPALQRARALSSATTNEIYAFEEILNDG